MPTKKVKILLKRQINKKGKDDFSNLLKHSEKTARKLWKNKVDDVWESV